jgi:uncharacterized protein GlcG (DUF336 family)
MLVESTLTAGRELGFAPLAAAVVDLAGEVLALHRADGAHPLTSRIAVGKARTALVTLISSGECEHLPTAIQDAARHLYHGDFVTRAGGLPVVRSGVVQGAIGVSGAASDEDEAAARVGLDAWASA